MVTYCRSKFQIVHAGSVLFHSAFHPKVVGGSFGCECAGEPVQQSQEEGRPLTQQRRGSGPCPVYRMVAAPVSESSQQHDHAGQLL